MTEYMSKNSHKINILGRQYFRENKVLSTKTYVTIEYTVTQTSPY